MSENTLKTTSPFLSNSQLYGIIALRVLIGWHLLYEGVSKILNPYWSSAAFLLDSKWIFSGVAKSIASNPDLLTFVDYLNIYGLTAIGFSLILGLFSRLSSLFGAILILTYYLFAPPFIGLEYSRPAEGSYIIINKNLIEACALFVLYHFPTGHIVGLDKFFINKIPFWE